MARTVAMSPSARSPTTLPWQSLRQGTGTLEDPVQCGNPACLRRWLSLLKDRRRPIFEQRWGCSRRCVEAIAFAALRRESGEGEEIEGANAHRHRVPLGLILLGQGWITQSQLQRALEMQQRAGSGRIGRWLTEECGVATDCVTRGLGMQWGCPVIGIEGFQPEAMVRAAPRLLIETLGMVPLRVVGRRILYLAFADRMDASAAFAMERMSGLKVESGLANAAELRAARDRLCACDFVDARYDQVADLESMAKRMAAAVVKFKPRASRLVRIHEFYWLRMWLEEGSMSSGNGGIPASKEDVADRVYELAAQSGE